MGLWSQINPKGIDGGPTFFAIFEELMGRRDVLDLELVAIMA
jgi:hypothetical protein